MIRGKRVRRDEEIIEVNSDFPPPKLTSRKLQKNNRETCRPGYKEEGRQVLEIRCMGVTRSCVSFLTHHLVTREGCPNFLCTLYQRYVSYIFLLWVISLYLWTSALYKLFVSKVSLFLCFYRVFCVSRTTHNVLMKASCLIKRYYGQ